MSSEEINQYVITVSLRTDPRIGEALREFCTKMNLTDLQNHLMWEGIFHGAIMAEIQAGRAKITQK